MRSLLSFSLRLLLVLVGLLAAGSLIAKAQQAVQPAQAPFQIAGGDNISFKWQELQKGAGAVEIQNNTTTPRRLEITLSDLGFKGTDGKAFSNTAVIKLEPVTSNPEPSTVNVISFQLPIAGNAKIRITAVDPGLTLDPSSYNTHYLNKPFGAISDYVTVLLYGVGVKATLDTIYAAIDKVLKRA